MTYKELKQKLLTSSQAFRKEYFTRDLQQEVADLIVLHRIRKNLTQKDLAIKIGTKQSGISRAERGTAFPSFSLLEKIAGALEMELVIDFKEANTRTFSGWAVKSHYYQPVKINQMNIHINNQYPSLLVAI